MPAFAIAQHSRVTGLTRRDAEKARTSAAQYGIPYSFTSTEELARCEEVDAVFVATPDALHLRDVIAVLRAGKPVLCEKPMAMNAGEVEEMIAAAKAAGQLLAVAHVFRFEQSTRRLRDRIAFGEIGVPALARAEFCYPAFESARTWITNPELATGGPIADVGVHCIDALRFILQDEVTSVACTARQDERSGGVDCAGAITLEFARGTLATVSVSSRTQYRTLLEFTGPRGVLAAFDGLNVERPVTLELRSSGDPRQVEREEVSNQLAYALQVDSFARAILDGEPFPATAEDGLRNQRILDAAFRSWHTGQRQTL